MDNVHVGEVTPQEYLESAMLAEEKSVSINDALAYIKMRKLGIVEAYTFDKHFHKLARVIQE